MSYCILKVNFLLCPGASVVNVYINYEKKFAFVEFRTGASSHCFPTTGCLPASLKVHTNNNWDGWSTPIHMVHRNLPVCWGASAQDHTLGFGPYDSPGWCFAL